MKVEKQIRKVEKVVEVEEPVYILEMSEIDIRRISKIIGHHSINSFNSILKEYDSTSDLYLNDGDSWIQDTWLSLRIGHNQ
jgi:hypothetical protein